MVDSLITIAKAISAVHSHPIAISMAVTFTSGRDQRRYAD